MADRIAVIIGNSNYTDSTLSQLITPNNDAEHFAKILEDPTMGGFDKIELLLNTKLTDIYKAIARLFANRRRDDFLLLYFSGHGILDEYGRLYLAVPETERLLLSATAIPSTFIRDEMDRSGSKRQLLILDCCHSGAFDRGTKSAFPVSIGTAVAFEGSGYGRFVLTATDTTQYAWEGNNIIGNAEHSVFTHYLIEGIETGQADIDDDGLITLEDLYTYLYEKVITVTPKQTPSKWTYKQQGDIIIARNQKSSAFSVITLNLPTDLQRAIISSLLGVRIVAIFELDKLLRASDEISIYSTDAKLALEYLSRDSEIEVSVAARKALMGNLSSEETENIIFAKGRDRLTSENNHETLDIGHGVGLTLVKVDAGKFLMGSHPDEKLTQINEFPQYAVSLPEYWIGKYPITVQQFEVFTKSTGYITTAERKGGGQAWKKFEWQEVKGGNWRHPLGKDSNVKGKKNHPVVFISWYDAVSFCKWASAATGIFIDLPTEAQWEKAARGTDGRLWPWGDSLPNQSLCNFALNIKQTTPVGSYSPGGNSYYDCADMSGNVWEWTNSVLHAYPYKDTYDGAVVDKSDRQQRVLRGGSFRSYMKRIRCSFRMEQPLDTCIDGYGFRVVAIFNS